VTVKKDYNYDLQKFVVSKLDNKSHKYHIDIGCGDRHLYKVIADGASLAFYKGIEADDVWEENSINIPNKGYTIYDYVYMLDVIEHLDEATLDMYFRKINKWMRNDGTLIISTPHINNLYQMVSFWEEPEHKRPYIKGTIEVLCNKYDLYIDKHYKFHWFINPFKRVVNELLGLDNWNKDIYFLKKAVK